MVEENTLNIQFITEGKAKLQEERQRHLVSLGEREHAGRHRYNIVSPSPSCPTPATLQSSTAAPPPGSPTSETAALLLGWVTQIPL